MGEIRTPEEMREAAANVADIVARDCDNDDYGMAAALRIAKRIRALPVAPREVPELHTAEEWHEDDGDVLWWSFPIEEPPYLGSPLDEDWMEGIYSYWTELLIPEAPK